MPQTPENVDPPAARQLRSRLSSNNDIGSDFPSAGRIKAIVESSAEFFGCLLINLNVFPCLRNDPDNDLVVSVEGC